MTNKKETVNHPSHYNVGQIEVIDIIESFGYEGDFCAGNVLKYFLRAPHKGDEEEDYRKASWYLERIMRRDAGAFHFLFHDRTLCSPMHIPVEKIRVHWYRPLNFGTEIQVSNVVVDWSLSGRRRDFLVKFHPTSLDLKGCSDILDSLIDDATDYDKITEEELLNREL